MFLSVRSTIHPTKCRELIQVSTKLNREAGLKTLLAGLQLIDPSGRSTKMYQERISEMTEAEYSHWISALESGKDFVSVIYENLTTSPISTANNLKVAANFGVKFFQRITMTDPKTNVRFTTNERYLVMEGRFRRQIQMLSNKMSVAQSNKVIDDLTDQPVGDSKGSSNSYPEMLVLVAQGHTKSIIELMKYRGGDRAGFNAMNQALLTTGEVNMSQLADVEGRAKSTVTLSTFLKAMHLNNDL